MDKNESLFEQAERCQQEGDFLGALKYLLHLKRQRFDRISTKPLEGEIRKLRLCDVDNNLEKEVGVLSKQKKFYLLPSSNHHSLLPPLECTNFCFLEDDNPKQVVIATEKTIKIYNIDPKTLELTFDYGLKTIAQTEILDIVFKQNRIFVSTTDKKIYQYTGHQFEDIKAFDTSLTIKRLFTGSKRADSYQHAMYNYLLGISYEGQLFLYDISQHKIKEHHSICKNTTFLDAFIIDFDNDGAEDIVVCSQNGHVVVCSTKSENLDKPKYSFKCFDEFYSLFCDDIDNDGNIEILVGSKSHYIYVLGLDENSKLVEKWKYKARHQIWSLRIRENHPHKELIVGLANGQVDIYRIFTPQMINPPISQAGNQLKQNKADFLYQLAKSNDPTLIEYGLDFVIQESNINECIKFIDSLPNLESDSLNLKVLKKLKSLLDANPNSIEIQNVLLIFVENLSKASLEGYICDQIDSVLHELTREHTIEKLQQLSKAFTDRVRSKKIATQQVNAIERYIRAGTVEQAKQILDSLDQTKTDLLNAFSTSSGILNVYSTFQKNTVLLTHDDKSVTFFDYVQKEKVKSFHLNELVLHYTALNHFNYKYLLTHGMTLELCDNADLSSMHKAYERVIQCAEVIQNSKNEFCWVVGLRNGKVIIDAWQDRINNQFEVSTYAVKITQQQENNSVNLFILTLDCKVYACYDVLRCEQLSLVWEPDIPYFNIIDFLAIDNHQFVIVSDEKIYFLTLNEKRLNLETICSIQKKELTCAIRGYYDNEPYIITGTRQKDLLFISLKTKEVVSSTIHLPYMPTALHCLDNKELLVGFEQGILHHYQFVSTQDIEELDKKCFDFQSIWDKHSFAEKLVLIALAKQSSTVEEIYERIDTKIATFLSQESILDAISSLEKGRHIQGYIESHTKVYRFKNGNYSHWVHKQQEELQVLETHKDEVFNRLSLPDIVNIADKLKPEGIKWLCGFMLMPPTKWEKLFSLAQQFKNSVISKTGQTFAKAYIQSVTKVLEESKITFEPPSSSCISFTLAIPTIKFQGFNTIAGFFLVEENFNFDEIQEKVYRRNAKIAFILTPDHKALLINTFKHESFDTIIFDQYDVKKIFLADNPRHSFLDLFIQQINVVALSPFQVAGPVTDMFYGRKTERQQILNALERPAAKNFAVIGPRKVGKTSLLKKIQAEIAYKKHFCSIFIDSMPYEMDGWYKAVFHKLGIEHTCKDASDFISTLQGYCQTQKCTLVLLVDEIDNILNQYAREHNDIFPRTLRALINEANIKILLAGYSTLYFQMRDQTSALFNMLESIELSSMERDSAHDLITEPLKEIYEVSGDASNQIFMQTGGYPNFIQFCCQVLIEEMLPNERIIRKDDVDAVTSTTRFSEHVTEVYLQNLDDKTKFVLYLMMCHYDKKLGQIVIDNVKRRQLDEHSQYVNAIHTQEIGNKFTPYEIRDLLEKYDVKLDDNDLNFIMKKLVLACILKRQENTRYTFVLPNLALLLVQHVEVELATVNFLEKIEELKNGW